MRAFTNCVFCAAAVLWIASGTAARAVTILQYGFDYTTGTVLSQGGTVNDDSGAGHHGQIIYGGTGGAYSADIPNAANRQYTTGVGSVDLTGTNSAISTAASVGVYSGQGILTATQIYNAGGLTMEVWVKNPAPSSSGNSPCGALVMGGMYILGANTAGQVGFFPGVDTKVTSWATNADTSKWTHLAVVMATTDPTAKTYTITSYVNGTQVYSAARTFPWFLDRATAMGNHPVFDASNYEGMIYEPRVSLGALDVSAFTYKVPEPSAIILLIAGLVGLLCYAWRKRK